MTLQEVWRERRLLVAHFWHRLLGTAGAWFFWCVRCPLRAWHLVARGSCVSLRTSGAWYVLCACAACYAPRVIGQGADEGYQVTSASCITASVLCPTP